MATKMETLLAELLEETTKGLLEKVRKGEATPADIKNIRELLKDNGITSDTGEEGNELDILSEELPFAAPLKLVSK
jgi:hypothetical protein